VNDEVLEMKMKKKKEEEQGRIREVCKR